MRTYKWTKKVEVEVEREQIEPEIGEVFEWEGMRLKCVVTPSKINAPCSKCSVESKCRVSHPETHPNCIATLRKDGESVYFIKYEEPKFTQEEAQEMYDTLGTIEAMLNDWATHEKIETFIWKGMFEYHANGIRTFLKGIKK